MNTEAEVGGKGPVRCRIPPHLLIMGMDIGMGMNLDHPRGKHGLYAEKCSRPYLEARAESHARRGL